MGQLDDSPSKVGPAQEYACEFDFLLGREYHQILVHEPTEVLELEPITASVVVCHAAGGLRKVPGVISACVRCNYLASNLCRSKYHTERWVPGGTRAVYLLVQSHQARRRLS